MSHKTDIIQFLEMFRTEIHEGRATALAGVTIDDGNRQSVVQILGWMCEMIEKDQPSHYGKLLHGIDRSANGV